MLQVCNETTERVQAQRRIAQSELRFRATFEQAAVGIAHVAADGRWLRVNEKLCEIVGYGREELLLRSIQDVTHPADVSADLALMQRLLAGSIDNYAMDERYVRKDGGIVWIRLTVSLLRHVDGTPDYAIAVIEDIDERKQTEQVLRRLRGEMEQLLTVHIASETAAAIAHELNQPLNAVASYTEAARQLLQSGNPKPERLLHALEESAAQVQRAGRVVRELLQFLHKSETSTDVVDLDAVVREALSIVEANGYGGFQAVTSLAADLKPVQANRLQVEKVLVNLLCNAVEAMRSDSSTARPMTITIGAAADHHMALVTVSDTGPGMDEAVMGRIFDPFFSTRPKGLGMGLAVSRALIEANGGRLWLEEHASPGATFHFTLPFAR
jgi:PAS domain S-box-containing protein